MIPALLRVNWLNLRRDRIALGVTFILPVAFFSVFGFILGGMDTMGGGGNDGADKDKPLRIVVVDEDQTELSRRFVRAIAAEDALEVATQGEPTAAKPDPRAYSQEEARKLVRGGEFPAAVILPAGWGESFGDFTLEADPVEVIYDSANPIARHTVNGLLQVAAMRAAPDILMEKGFGRLDDVDHGLTDFQRRAFDEVLSYVRGLRDEGLFDGGALGSSLDDSTADGSTASR